jgi:hypothetical protein
MVSTTVLNELNEHKSNSYRTRQIPTKLASDAIIHDGWQGMYASNTIKKSGRIANTERKKENLAVAMNRFLT